MTTMSWLLLQKTVVLNARGLHLTGLPAALVLLGILGLVLALLIRFLVVRRQAHFARATHAAMKTELETLLRAMTDLVVVIDRRGTVVRVVETSASIGAGSP